jgi:RHH-type proline utilization regulon transcriptional repressor/proline dehydrogenase/delta 1-pyrroline-5-carboxylate dehydrogenase
MDELLIGDPSQASTDVGPVISASAAEKLEEYSQRQQSNGVRLLKQCKLDGLQSRGNFFAPRLLELASASQLTSEEFGPVLHLVRYRRDQLDAVCEAIRTAGYGLTLGIHTRIESVWQQIAATAAVGNIYVNRNMIGAVVGVQPFGGEGLSGTGPKAGGPHYLLRFATERTLTVNTVATGGNAKLLSLGS